MGLAQAKEIALTGRVVESEEALRIGLINRIVPHEEIAGEVMKRPCKMAGRSPNILAITKRMLNTSHQVDLQTLLDLEAHVQSLAVLAPEHRETWRSSSKKLPASKRARSRREVVHCSRLG